jgi:AmmeMemoRadiSam system protein B
MVGQVNKQAQETYGKIFAPYLDDPSNVFVISSDFCHWGERFDYTPYDKKKGAIWQSIEAMDKEGMALIETQDPKKFNDYLAETCNTICGRKPILVFLNVSFFCCCQFLKICVRRLSSIV